MKNLYFFKLLIFILFSCSITHSFAAIGSGDTCKTAAMTTSVPNPGTMKVFIVFAQFKDEDLEPTNHWEPDSLPDWADGLVNATPSGSYPYSNLSHYFNEMSDGDFQVIGDVYDSLVITNYDTSSYSDIDEVNQEILERIDPYVDFSDYDTLNGSSYGTVSGHLKMRQSWAVESVPPILFNLCF